MPFEPRNSQVCRDHILDRTAQWLKQALGYEFCNASLLAQALTHRSAATYNNERLEFLGDAVLDFVVSDLVYEKRPDADEGELSRLRASLVRDTTLVELATELTLGDHLILGSGEKKSGGHGRASILADALEAIFGAIYLDSGFDAAEKVIRSAFAGRADCLPDPDELKDPKTRLQEYLQGDGYPLPVYATVQVSGKAHQQVFDVSCTIVEHDIVTQGRGRSRRDAEQAAASKMLEELREG